MAILVKEETTLENDLNKIYIKIFALTIITIISFFIYKPISILIFIFLFFNAKSKKLLMYKQGFIGESYLKKVLLELNDDYQLLFDVTVETDGKSSQLDSIIISNHGIFIVEVKHINGNVLGDINDYNLTIEKTGQKGTKYYKKLYNPYKQVKTHTYRLSRFLKLHNIYCPVVGLVFFKCEETFFNNTYVNVSNSDGIIFTDPTELLEKIEFTNLKNIETIKDKIINLLI